MRNQEKVTIGIDKELLTVERAHFLVEKNL